MSRLIQITAPVVDLLYQVRAVPASGQEAVVTGFESAVGGGYNAMLAARRQGMAVALAGTLGTGPFAALVRDALEREEMQVLREPRSGLDQGCCVVMIEPSGERSFVAAPGAEGHLAPGDLDCAGERPDDWLMVSGYTLLYPDSGEEVARRMAAGPASKVIFDPSPLVAEIPKERLKPVLAAATWISANAAEAAVLTGHEDPHEAARALALVRPDGGAVVRCGARGAVLATAGELHLVAPLPVTAIDTNGAGDCHIGAFVAEMAQTGDPLRAVLYANVAAALSTTVAGPATSPCREEVEAHLTVRPYHRQPDITPTGERS